MNRKNIRSGWSYRESLNCFSIGKEMALYRVNEKAMRTLNTSGKRLRGNG